MYKHEKKYCPRCGVAFECKVGSILLCQCSTVQLSEKERDYVQNHYEDCLCAKCLGIVRSEYHNRKFKEKIDNLLQMGRSK